MSNATSKAFDPATQLSLPRQMLRSCARNRFRRKAVDTTGGKLTGGQTLMRALILRRLLERHVLAPDEKRIGVLLPPSTGGLVVNAALALMGRVAVNLNYSASEETINACIKAAGIRHVLTSGKVLEKLGMNLAGEAVLLESFKDKVTFGDKLAGAVGGYLTPVAALERRLGLGAIDMQDPVTIVFTSGSTGRPKGVVLTHDNIVSNIRAFESAVHLDRDDVLLGILPFFHAFGYTVTLWAPLILDLSGAYHFNPLDAKQVGKLCHETKATILLSTPTFLRSYIKRVPPEEFATLDVVVVGAEKMPIPLAETFEKRFGVRPVEGYGATELAPVAAVNIPPTRSRTPEPDLREGSIGKPLPGVQARVVDPETFVELPVDAEGMLEVTGPNLMQGYLDDPEKTAEVVKDGWYITGDMARIDPDGFIYITGRQSRFSKIGGEMVPHLRVEEEIQNYLAAEDEERQLAVVTGVPDEKKGERLVVLHLPIDKTPDEIATALRAVGLPNLWIPGTDSFLEVQELPLLGSGKLDLKGLAKKALEHFGK